MGGRDVNNLAVGLDNGCAQGCRTVKAGYAQRLEVGIVIIVQHIDGQAAPVKQLIDAYMDLVVKCTRRELGDKGTFIVEAAGVFGAVAQLQGAGVAEECRISVAASITGAHYVAVAVVVAVSQSPVVSGLMSDDADGVDTPCIGPGTADGVDISHPKRAAGVVARDQVGQVVGKTAVARGAGAPLAPELTERDVVVVEFIIIKLRLADNQAGQFIGDQRIAGVNNADFVYYFVDAVLYALQIGAILEEYLVVDVEGNLRKPQVTAHGAERFGRHIFIIGRRCAGLLHGLNRPLTAGWVVPRPGAVAGRGCLGKPNPAHAHRRDDVGLFNQHVFGPCRPAESL